LNLRRSAEDAEGGFFAPFCRAKILRETRIRFARNVSVPGWNEESGLAISPFA
jgi:hypothetical protein